MMYVCMYGMDEEVEEMEMVERDGGVELDGKRCSTR